MKRKYNPKNFIDKDVYITQGIYKGQWGTIVYYDGDDFHVALWDGVETIVLSRDEFNIRN